MALILEVILAQNQANIFCSWQKVGLNVCEEVAMICFDLFGSGTQQINFTDYYSWEKLSTSSPLKGSGLRGAKLCDL